MIKLMTMKNPHHRDLEDYKIVEDSNCGFRQLSPIPSEEELKELYTEDYYQDHYPEWIEKSLKEKDYWLMMYEDRFDALEKRTEKRRILDIGSFLGFFLEVGQKRGWDCLGIEPSTPAREIAIKAGIDTKSGLFEDYTVDDIGTFDVINLALTLEHIRDPKLTIERIYQFLNPGGLIVIEVPNDFNPLQEAAQKVLGVHQYWLAPPHHINYFNFDNLPKLLKNCGFETIHKMATFPMELFLMMGENYIGNNEVGSSCHSRRMTFEKNMNKAGLNNMRAKLYDFFASEGIGREMIVFGEKID
ncbi:class I SAM-dependent methyltransferase [Candidatus Marinamargulisbacteria bacterium SCGC AAA071-K20]|nr:class I SAM-dependent methyltransferase [Candidatus Marinamargulisbacteria bacterium SCGC AAA071-K20]